MRQDLSIDLDCVPCVTDLERQVSIHGVEIIGDDGGFCQAGAAIRFPKPHIVPLIRKLKAFLGDFERVDLTGFCDSLKETTTHAQIGHIRDGLMCCVSSLVKQAHKRIDDEAKNEA